MEALPHIDIVEEERIKAILENTDNFVFDAISCETLDGWVPDLGLTSYRNYSIYRPPSVAQSGIASTLAHRFWSTVEGKTDHTGPRYIGVVIYDTFGEPCPLEFRLGADDIGRVEPTRHDNRRHLIVVDKPVPFIGSMEVFQLKAPGKGTYRIETFVLIRERPEPSSFMPRIERLSARVVERESERISAAIDFITSQVANAHIEATSERDARVAETKTPTKTPTKLHTVTLANLLPDRDYTVKVTATEQSGTSVTEAISLFTGVREAYANSPTTVPVEIINLSTAEASELPLTFSVPLPQTQIFDPANCHLKSGSFNQPAQTRVHSHWPDGSARWVLVDVPCPGPLAPDARKQGEVVFGSDAVDQTLGLTWEAKEDRIIVTGQHLRVSVDKTEGALPAQIERRNTQGEWQEVLGALGDKVASFAVTLGNGLTLQTGTIDDLTLEEAGAERAVIRYRVPHQDAEGVAHLRSSVRLHIYARHPFVKMVHRLEVISPALPPTAGGTVADLAPGFDDIRAAIAGNEGEEATLLTLDSVKLRLPRLGNTQVTLDEQVYSVNGDTAWRIVHEHDLARCIEANGSKREVEGRSRGHILVEGTTGPLAVGVRNFWETYPKGLSVTEEGVSVELLPTLSGAALPGDEDAWHRIYFWHDKGKYRLKSGMALTSEVLIALPDTADEATRWFAWFEKSPAVRPNLDWLNETHVLSSIASKVDSPSPQYEATIDQTYHEWRKDRDHWRQYGFMNFGDWYGEGTWCWGNNEYDAAYGHYMEFLRGGVPHWFTLAGQAARHLADVDTVNFSKKPSQVGGQYIHMPGHAGGFLPPYFRSKIKGSNLIPSHMWVEGPVLHYLLTGDETLRESLDRTADFLIHGGMRDISGGLDHYDYSSCRECGWYLIHLCAVARMMDNPRYLNAAYIILERVLERQEPGGGWLRMLMEGHCAGPPPRQRGEAGFMVGVLLEGLRRLHELTGDERVAEAIVGGARWLIDNVYEPDKKHFRYTPCTNRGGGAGPVFTLGVIAGLGYAYHLSGDPSMGAILKHALKEVGQPHAMFDELNHTGFGKDVCFETRFVPTLLAYVQMHSKQ